jgi:hypothetical protein
MRYNHRVGGWVVVGLVLAVDIAGVVVGIRLWRSRSHGAPLRPGAAVYLALTVVVIVLAIMSVLAGLVKAYGAIGGESVDPSQKARILAEGISEAMNVSAFGALVATPLAIGVLVYAWLRRRGDPQRG